MFHGYHKTSLGSKKKEASRTNNNNGEAYRCFASKNKLKINKTSIKMSLGAFWVWNGVANTKAGVLSNLLIKRWDKEAV